MIQVEICTNSVASAIHAQRAGAQRVELCHNLNEGGTTPSAAAIEYCVKQLGLRTHVLIRPRSGNFIYSPEEWHVTLRDIDYCRQLGAHAVVIGCLTPQGNIDMEKTRQAVEAAGDVEVTFHRAFDECRNWQQGLEDIIACGCHRILTSGQAATAFLGRDTLRQMVDQAKGRIEILAGCGVTSANVVQLVQETGVHEVHGSCKQTVDGVVETDEEEVRRLLESLRTAGR